MMKKLSAIILMLFASTIYSQITLIPDPEFEEVLIIQGVDSDGIINGQVLTSDIDWIVNLFFIGNPLITDLTGIEDFVSLEHLDINSMNITEINLSENSNLKILGISDVSLNNLDITNNLMLEQLNISLNFTGGFFTSPITYIDLSSNIQLISVLISGSFITHFDITNNINIGGLELKHMDELTYVNLKNDNNENLGWLQLVDNENLGCVQVDDPLAAIEGIDPPYDNWVIENNPIITDDCNLGIKEYLAKGIVFYPNPVKNIIQISSNDLQIIGIEVYNTLGKKVLSKKGAISQLNLSGLATGLYLVKIQTENGELVKKVIKE